VKLTRDGSTVGWSGGFGEGLAIDSHSTGMDFGGGLVERAGRAQSERFGMLQTMET
jgi:hypothetical protein